ncbi:hypothetical protein [Acidisphaera sp. L21]|uniref:hypothetical protein n=1 Tax=Acidisphaera sp. L21 TaxID=1641851 RepID=UPI00131D4078|nr:hypothetical protein [Acidisphaera sp. L21]
MIYSARHLQAGALHGGGTRVRLFPELFAGYAEPETAFLSPRPGSVRPGPADDQMYVANAVDKTEYEPPEYGPPFRGREYAPAMPSSAGHFDQIPVEAPQFLAAHLYGGARHTLDIWEHYLGRPVQWWHAPQIPQLELIPTVDWPNAHSGPGFLETGIIVNEQKRQHLFCLNFDVVAHEIGHAILFATVGVPAPGALTAEYLAFHESFADLVAVIGVLRFQSVIVRLLTQTGGNLHALNLVNRIGRYSDNQQIRVASNATTMADVADLHLLPSGDWDDPTGKDRNQHALGEPLTGAIFDLLAEVFQNRLAARGLVGPEMDARNAEPAHVERVLPQLHRHFARQFDQFPAAFADALLEARDAVGYGMAQAMHMLHPETLNFARVAACVLAAVCRLGERQHIRAMLHLFLDRGIDPRPYLTVERETICYVSGDPARRRESEHAAFLHANSMVRRNHRGHGH